jgi:hypothetical protein
LRNPEIDVSRGRKIEQGQRQLNSYLTGQANDSPGKGTLFIENQRMSAGVAHPARSGAGDGSHQGFDLIESRSKGAIGFSLRSFLSTCTVCINVGRESQRMFRVE